MIGRVKICHCQHHNNKCNNILPTMHSIVFDIVLSLLIPNVRPVGGCSLPGQLAIMKMPSKHCQGEDD